AWISPDEKKEIKDEQEFMPYFPESLSPFYHEEKIAYHPSLALKYKDRVVGWLITYWNTPTTLEYNNIFIRKEYRLGMRTPLEMIRVASMRQVEQGVPDILWSVGEENSLLEQYLDKKFGDYSDKATIYRASKKLK
ncbi:MAG: hypothetical protein ACP5E3_15245, partial [Bacteroidales bacterium]